MLGSNVGHHVGRLLAAKLAVRTLKARLLATLVLVMPGHVSLDGEAATASRTAVRLVVGLSLQHERALRISVPLRSRESSDPTWHDMTTTQASARHGRVVLAEVLVAALALVDLTGLQYKTQVQLRGCRVETCNFKVSQLIGRKRTSPGFFGEVC